MKGAWNLPLFFVGGNIGCCLKKFSSSFCQFFEILASFVKAIEQHLHPLSAQTFSHSNKIIKSS
jgi:hypothetical protein